MNTSHNLNEVSSNAKVSRVAVAGIPWPAFAFLALTAAISLSWSYFKLLWWDEFLVLWTDSAPTMGQVVHIQSTWPISLDPIAFHGIAHAAIQIFGANAFAVRLPSLLGFLLMQICIFVFVRRIAGEKPAVFALAFPALTATFYYSAEGRPYGLLLGLSALAMVSWQSAMRRESKRTLALAVLALSVAFALNAHYYAVLFLIPLCGAELFRTIRRKRLDWPMIASIGAGAAGVAFTLPFIKAAANFRAHYYNLQSVDPATIGKAYIGMLHASPITVNHEIASQALLLVFAALLCIHLLRSGKALMPEAEAVFVVLLAALPVFGYLLARFVTHIIEARFVLGAVIGISVLLALGFSSLCRHVRIANAVLVLLFAAIGAYGSWHVRRERHLARETLSALNLAPEIKAVLMASPTKALYFSSGSEFANMSYYGPDPNIRSRAVLVYSTDLDLHWNHIDTYSLQALHMRNFTYFKIESYESISAEPGPHVFVDCTDPVWNWIDRAFSVSGADVRLLGSAFGCKVVSAGSLP